MRNQEAEGSLIIHTVGERSAPVVARLATELGNVRGPDSFHRPDPESDFFIIVGSKKPRRPKFSEPKFSPRRSGSDLLLGVYPISALSLEDTEAARTLESVGHAIESPTEAIDAIDQELRFLEKSSVRSVCHVVTFDAVTPPTRVRQALETYQTQLPGNHFAVLATPLSVIKGDVFPNPDDTKAFIKGVQEFPPSEWKMPVLVMSAEERGPLVGLAGWLANSYTMAGINHFDFEQTLHELTQRRSPLIGITTEEALATRAKDITSLWGVREKFNDIDLPDAVAQGLTRLHRVGRADKRNEFLGVMAKGRGAYTVIQLKDGVFDPIWMGANSFFRELGERFSTLASKENISLDGFTLGLRRVAFLDQGYTVSFGNTQIPDLRYEGIVRQGKTYTRQVIGNLAMFFSAQMVTEKMQLPGVSGQLGLPMAVASES